jgi:hypothetical protein
MSFMKNAHKFWSENLKEKRMKERKNLGNLGVDNIRVNLKEILEAVEEQIQLFQDRNEWLAFVHTQMKLRVP